MTRLVHFEVEVLYETTVGPACGYNAAGKLTDDLADVTCRSCLTLLGYEAAPVERLTVCEPDPLKVAA
jgi:hypothetical protein